MSVQKKFIVTGAQGFVAGSVLAQAGDRYEIHALTRNLSAARDLAGKFPHRIEWHGYDPGAARNHFQSEECQRLFNFVRPDAVIHTAALADIDYCQANREEASVINVNFTGVLAELCADFNARLIFCSTDTVFDGEHAPYNEDSLPSPVNFYAETKAAAERAVAELGCLGVIARLSLVMGLPILGAGNSFLVRMLAALKEGRIVGVPPREIRTPVDVVTVGRALLELAAGRHEGVFHIAGLTRINRFEMGQRLAERFGYAKNLVVPQNPAPGRAPRPRDVSLDARKTAARLATPLRTLDDGISLVQETAASVSK